MVCILPFHLPFAFFAFLLFFISFLPLVLCALVSPKDIYHENCLFVVVFDDSLSKTKAGRCTDTCTGTCITTYHNVEVEDVGDE